MKPVEPTRAACLTAPAMGGVAIVQVVGRDAPALLNPLLASKKSLDLTQLSAGELRLCRFYDGSEVIDEALVSIRYNQHGEPVVDLSLHGGPRIVQRVMLALKRAGVAILEAPKTKDHSWHTQNLIEEEAVSLLLRAKTRAVAAWLVEMKERFISQTQRMIADMQAGNVDLVRTELEKLINNNHKVKYLIEGVRVVLVGEPNVGKSTLANALSDRDQAIVSDVPGTTRDYTEHSAAAERLPLTIVDTAGVREAEDVLEQEAIRRTHEQLQAADVIIQVLDASNPVDVPDSTIQGIPRLVVWNKCDQARSAIRNPRSEILISALTGAGLPELRTELLSILGLSDWLKLRACFTARQALLCEGVLSIAGIQPPEAVIQKLSELVGHVR